MRGRAKAQGKELDVVFAAARDAIPAGRFGTIEEYVATVLHPAGEHYMTGQVLSPNGGSVI